MTLPQADTNKDGKHSAAHCRTAPDGGAAGAPAHDGPATEAPATA